MLRGESTEEGSTTCVITEYPPDYFKIIKYYKYSKEQKSNVLVTKEEFDRTPPLLISSKDMERMTKTMEMYTKGVLPYIRGIKPNA